MAAKKLTQKDHERIQEYLAAMKDLEAQEPEYQLDAASGEAWEAWNKKGADLTREYSDVIRKALMFSLGDMGDTAPQSVAAILEAFISSPATEGKALIVRAIRAQQIEYPIDKVNSEIWRLLENDTGGQLVLKAEKFGSKKPVNILYSIDFDALEMDEGITITKRLLPFDKRVYIAVSALFNAGCEVITLTQIYYAMGYTGNPGKSDLERINNSISKMAWAKVIVNNAEEAAVYNYERFDYDGALLPLERVTAVMNGKATEAAIHLFREPPIMSFAKQRKQITTIDMKLLQSPISKSDSNLLIEDYLIERIAWAKSGRASRRILFKTLYEKARITTVKQKQRAPAKIKRYLDHYQKCGLILKYTMDSDGVTVFFKNEEPTEETAATA